MHIWKSRNSRVPEIGQTFGGLRPCAYAHRYHGGGLPPPARAAPSRLRPSGFGHLPSWAATETPRSSRGGRLAATVHPLLKNRPPAIRTGTLKAAPCRQPPAAASRPRHRNASPGRLLCGVDRENGENRALSFERRITRTETVHERMRFDGYGIFSERVSRRPQLTDVAEMATVIGKCWYKGSHRTYIGSHGSVPAAMARKRTGSRIVTSRLSTISKPIFLNFDSNRLMLSIVKPR